jgi:acyl-CoA dehydrogenase
MDFELSDDSLAMQASTQNVVNDMLRYEPHFHETNEVHEEVDTTLRDVGYYGLSIPEEFGGTPVDKVTLALVQMELARMPPSSGRRFARPWGPSPNCCSCTARQGKGTIGCRGSQPVRPSDLH